MLGARRRRPLEDSPGSVPSQPPLTGWVTQGNWQGGMLHPPAGLEVSFQVDSVWMCVRGLSGRR